MELPDDMHPDDRAEIEAAGPMWQSHLHILIEAFDDGGDAALIERSHELGQDITKVITRAQAVGLYVSTLAMLVRETAPFRD